MNLTVISAFSLILQSLILLVSSDNNGELLSFHVRKLSETNELEYSCRGATSMKFYECETLQDCDTVKDLCTSSETVLRRRRGKCHVSEECEEEGTVKCLSVTLDDEKRGMILCNNTASSLQREIFSDVKGRKAFNINYQTGDAKSPQGKVEWITFLPLEYGTWNNVRDFSLYEKARFQCNVSQVIGKGDIEWLVELNGNNSNLVKAQIENELRFETKPILSSEVTVTFNKSEITRLVCRAPRRFEGEGGSRYLDVSSSIRITPYSDLVLFDNNPPGMEEVRHVSTPNKVDGDHKLKCKASGVGVTISWEKNGFEVGGTHTVLNEKVDNDVWLSTLIIFHDISAWTLGEDPSNKDNYTCVVEDILGRSLKKKFTVIWEASTQNHLWLWIWSLCALIGLLLFFGGLLLFIMERRRKSDPYYQIFKEFKHGRLIKKEKNMKDTEGEKAEVNNCSEDGTNDYYVYQPSDTKFEISEKDLILKPKDAPVPISSGNFGEVYLGELKVDTDGSCIPVAVKTLKDYPSPKDLRDFLNEIKLLQNVGTHESIVTFHGSVTDGIEKHRKNLSSLLNPKIGKDILPFPKEVLPKIVLEYCEFGDIHSYLISLKEDAERRGAGVESFFEDEINPKSATSGYIAISCKTDDSSPPGGIGNYVQAQPKIRTTHLFNWCYEIAEGMEFLASKGIVHRDLAARNVLLTNNLNAKITDFGLAKDIQQSGKCYYSPSSGFRDEVPARWVSPEVLEERKFSTFSDIWSMGVTMWEIFTLCQFTPYSHISNEDLIIQLRAELIEKEQRLDRPRFANDKIWEVIQKCWQFEKYKRPSFSELKNLINEAAAPSGRFGSFSSYDSGTEENETERETSTSRSRTSSASFTSSSSTQTLSEITNRGTPTPKEDRDNYYSLVNISTGDGDPMTFTQRPSPQIFFVPSPSSNQEMVV